jgi:hypothetical protein
MIPENKQNRRYKQIKLIDLQNNLHPSQHTVGNVHKASEYQECFLWVKAAGARADNLATFMCRLFETWERQPPGTLKVYLGL